MTDLIETGGWVEGVYQIEMTDPVVGGPPDVTNGQGIANVQAQQLAQRTAFLKGIVDALSNAETFEVSTNSDLNVDGALLTTRASIRIAIGAAIDALVDGAPGALDTLNELSVALGDSDDAVAALTSSIANKLNSSAYTAADVLAKLLSVGVATKVEAEAGVIHNKVMTPLRVAQAIVASLGSLEGLAPTGAVIYFAADAAPTGFLKANGAALNTTTYAALFAIVGYTFGGSGSSFNLPDLRGEFLRGWDDARGIDGSRAFGSAQGDEFKAHKHTETYRETGGRADPQTSGVASVGGLLAVNTGSTGGSETRPRNVALLACIKY
jgi:microcystin-dependent protein